MKKIIYDFCKEIHTFSYSNALNIISMYPVINIREYSEIIAKTAYQKINDPPLKLLINKVFNFIKKEIQFKENKEIKFKKGQKIVEKGEEIIEKIWKIRSKKSIEDIQSIAATIVADYISLIFNLKDKKLYNAEMHSAWMSCNLLKCYSSYTDDKRKIAEFINNLIKTFKRKIKQFNTKEHNNTYHESILKEIINIDYNKLENVDKNQAKDIINEYYEIEINDFDFITHKTIELEFKDNPLSTS